MSIPNFYCETLYMYASSVRLVSKKSPQNNQIRRSKIGTFVLHIYDTIKHVCPEGTKTNVYHNANLYV